MKTRESGMPDEKLWDTFFDPERILDALGIKNIQGNIADIGCGYGTFTIPAGKRTKGVVYGLDIEEEMVTMTNEKAKRHGLKNVVAKKRDFVFERTGLADLSCEVVMLFNILHAEKPVKILKEAKRILTSKGKVAVIHWIADPATPRGPPMDIRPSPSQIQNWLIEAGFKLRGEVISLPPYHFGVVGIK